MATFNGYEGRIRIVHLSDTHFGGPAAWQTRQVLGDGFWGKLRGCRSDMDVDLVFFTGDLGNHGKAGDYAKATEYVERVLSELKVARDRFFVVPGNHDVDRDPAKTSWRALRRRIEARERIDARTYRVKLSAREDAYWDWVRGPLGRPTLAPEGDASYVECLRLPDLPFDVHIVGFDTAWAAGARLEQGLLLVDRDDFGARLHDSDGHPLVGLRLGLCHHPFDWLANEREVNDLARERLDLVFRGHLHRAELEARLSPGERVLPCVAAGSLVDGYDADLGYNGFEVVDLATDAQGSVARVEVTFFGWQGHFWAPDNFVYRDAVNGRVAWDFR